MRENPALKSKLGGWIAASDLELPFRSGSQRNLPDAVLPTTGELPVNNWQQLRVDSARPPGIIGAWQPLRK